MTKNATTYRPAPIPPDIVQATVKACHARYGRDPNVVGVGFGLKFQNGRPLQNVVCIHFYVRRKRSAVPPRLRLPKFVYARVKGNRVDRSQRILTDVIPVGASKLAQQAGMEIIHDGQAGTITLVFNNLAHAKRKSYLITCAHVAGDLTQSPPPHPLLRYRKGGALASTVFSATAPQRVVDYDVALASLLSHCPQADTLRVAGTPRKLSDFLPADQIPLGLDVECAFPVSRVARAVVASSRTSLPITVNGCEYVVNNLYFIDQKVMGGDSGGLVYQGTLAVGVLVAMSDEGLGLFQPLEEAFTYIQQQLSPELIRCF